MIAGLLSAPKRLPSKLFYDERGSQLFDEITRLDEYYLTRTEISIFERYLPEMAALVGPNALVIEFGTGAGIKTAMLLRSLDHPRAYIPIDISSEQLAIASRELSARFPTVAVHPVCADYTESFRLPVVERGERNVIFFPGSTIGNFEPPGAVEFLRRAASLVGTPGALLIGFDRVKDRKTLEAAYNDKKGVTAQFNRHLIERVAEGFEVSISPEDFEHYAFYNEPENRIEMHLVSRKSQVLCLDSQTIHLAAGEHIITEYSYKYTPESFAKILAESGFQVSNTWTDPMDYFEVCYAVVQR